MGVIYLATNKINNKKYVGKSYSSMEERKADHLYSAKTGSRFVFHNAIRKYGWINFEWDVVEENVPDDKLNELEIDSIKWFGSKVPHGYNMTDGGEGTLGWEPTEESRAKMREKATGRKHTNETKKALAEISSNREQTQQAKDKVRKFHTGRKRSQETVKRLSEAQERLNRWRDWESCSSQETRKLPCSPEATARKRSEAMTGHPVSVETRAKIGAKKKGQRHTQEAKDKVSRANTGLKRSEEFKRRVSEVHTGRKDTPETTKRRSMVQLGKHHTVETKKLISEHSMGRKHSDETKAKMSLTHAGHETSQETRTKLSQSLRGNEKLIQAQRSRRIREGFLAATCRLGI